MARWVDVRVEAHRQAYALRALMDALAPLDLTIDPNPQQAPSARAGDGSPGEVEFRVCDHPEATVRAVLEARGVEVLSSRTRMGERLRGRPD